MAQLKLPQGHPRRKGGRETSGPFGMRTKLVIGYGNVLRRDDALGCHVATVVAGWQIPHIHAMALHQVTPELAETVAGSDRVIFVDAHVAGNGPPVKVLRLKPARSSTVLGHKSDPASVLALADALYGRYPAAWLVTVAGSDFGPGEELSDTARRGMDAALEEIARLLDSVADHIDIHSS